MPPRLKIVNETEAQAHKRLAKEFQQVFLLRAETYPFVYIAKFYRGYNSRKLVCRLTIKTPSRLLLEPAQYLESTRKRVYEWLEKNGFHSVRISTPVFSDSYQITVNKYRVYVRVRDSQNRNRMAPSGNLKWNFYLSANGATNFYDD